MDIMVKGSQTAYVLFFCLLSHAALFGQQHPVEFEHINLQQGLSQGSVYGIIQDHWGYMWFGTQDGLNKYDGYQFTVYRHNRNDSASLSDNFINAVCEDRSGKFLWVGTLSGGLNLLNRQTNSFRSYQVKDDGTGISSNTVSCIYQDHNGDLWVGTDNGLNRIVRDQQGNLTFTKFFHNAADPNSLSNNYVTCILEDDQKNLWIGTRRGLNRYDPQTHSFRLFLMKSDTTKRKYNDVSALYEDDKHNLLAGTQGGGLFKCALSSAVIEFTTVPFEGIQRNEVSAILQDPEKKFWIAFREEGLVRWDPETGDHLQLRTNPMQPKSLSNDRVSTLCSDTFGNTWIGTLNGINRLNITNRKFIFYQNKPGLPEDIHNSIFAIVKDHDGRIWTGTRAGLFCLASGKQPEAYLHQKGSSHYRLDEDAVRALLIDNHGTLWAGTEKGTIETVDPVKKTFASYPVDAELNENPVYVMRQDKKNILWLGTFNGLYSMDPATGKFRHYDWQKTINTNTKIREIRSMALDKDDNLWIGTRGAGAFLFDTKNETFRHFANDPNDPHSLSHNVVACIYVDNTTDIVWLGTSSGFNKYENGKFYSYTEHDGLPNDVVYGILPDDFGYLWLSTNNGVSRYSVRDNTFRNYDTSDGLQSSEFNAGGYYKSEDGELFFGGINGYNSFYPEKIVDNTLKPEVVLTGFKVFNEDVSLDSAMEYIDHIDLTYRDYVFSLEFAAIHLTAPEKNQYAYMLEGFDHEWVYTQRRFATYTNLDPGTYTFRVKASNNDSLWNDDGLSLTIRIAPPFWQTWWFYALVILFVAGMIYSVYQVRVNQIQKEEKLKTEFNKKFAEIEMTALRAQMNPHFLFNCLNSINRYIVRNDPEAASNYLTKFSRLIRLILQNSKSQTISLKNELEALKLYIEMEEMRFENRFDYTLHLAEDVEAEYIEVPPLLLQPYVENAIWHGLMHKESRGRLTIDIRKENGLLKCIIEDNGVGRAKAAELKSKSATRNKSMGMKITTDRLSLYQAQTSVEITDLQDETGNPCGTRVLLSLPYSVELQQPVNFENQNKP